jgi:hypothetical protein
MQASPRVIGCIDGTHVRIQAPNAPILPAALALPVGLQADDQAQGQGGPVDDDAEQPKQQQQPEQDADAMDMDALPLDRHRHDHVNPYDQPPVPPVQRIPNYEASFVNRKGYHSLNIQAVCDHTGKLMLYFYTSYKT